jgi:pimeloyl-ACP methyl ester carboxylesterase
MIRSGFAAEDQLILDRSMVWETLQTDIAEAFRQGIGGLAHEITLYTLAWGIDLRRIQVPVELWHGEQDKNIPASTVEQLSQSLTCSSVKILPGCGHLLIVDNMSRIVQTLLP